MSKELIEKAFNEWIKYRAGLDKYSAMSAWQAGATWQREQLIKELREWITSNNRYIGLNGAGPVLLPEELLAKLDLLEKGIK